MIIYALAEAPTLFASRNSGSGTSHGPIFIVIGVVVLIGLCVAILVSKRRR